MFQEAASVEEVPISLREGNELIDVNLHSVDSISDLHWAAPEITKSKEGNDHSGSGTPRTLQAQSKSLAEDELATLPPQQPISSLHLPGPSSPRALLAILAVLLLVGIILAAITLWLNVHQSKSLQALSQRLASQEETVLQIKLTSSQLWKRLKANVTRRDI